MNRIFDAFESVVYARGGMVEKYIGDALVAVFGYPVLHEDDPARALDAALEFNKAVSGLSANPPVFRTGVHTGLVATGRRGQFDVVTGHTMSCASRIESRASPGQILVSEETVERCRGHFVFGDLVRFVPKGDHQVLSVRPLIGRRRSAIQYDTPFVGRHPELDTLMGAFVRPVGAERFGAYIHGDAGLGKSRLASEFCQKIRHYPEFRSVILLANPSQFPELPYSTILRLILDALELEPDAPAPAIQAALLRILPQMPRELPCVLDALLALARPLDHASPAASGSATAKPGEVKILESLCQVFEAVLSVCCTIYPAIVVIDNAAMMDSWSRDFFRQYLSGSGERPFFLLCDRRLHKDVASIFGISTILGMKPFQDDEAAELVRLLAGRDADEALVERIVKLAQGYPLFIEEYSRLAARGRSLEDMPDTVQTAILASLDRFEPSSRSLLQRLSVFKYPFTEAAALMMGKVEPFPVESPGDCLATLVEDGILLRSGQGFFGFRHARIREALYGSILNHNKKILHSVAAEATMTHSPSREDEILYHFVGAMQWDRAREYLFNVVTILGLDSEPVIRRLLEATGPELPEARIEMLFKEYAVRFNNHVYEGLEDILFEMHRLAWTTALDAPLARTYHLFMTYYLKFGDPCAAVRYGERAVERYASGVNPRGEANARFFLSEAYCRLGYYDRSGEIIQGIPGTTLASEIFRAKSMLIHKQYRSDYVGIEEWRLKVEEMEARAGNEKGLLDARFLWYSYMLQNFELDRVLDPERPEGTSGAEVDTALFYNASVASALARFGRREEAVEYFSRAEYFAAQMPGSDMECAADMWLAWAYWFAPGNSARAGYWARRALESALVSRSTWLEFESLVFLAMHALESGDQKLSDRYLVEARSMYRWDFHKERRVEAVYSWLCGDMERAGTLARLEQSTLLTEEARQHFARVPVFARMLAEQSD